MIKNTKKILPILFGIVLIPNEIFAHLADGRFGDFYAGSFHLLTAIEHLIPIIAVGLLVGQQSKKKSRLCTIIFPFTLLLGTILGIWIQGMTWSIYINSISFLVIGGLVAWNKKLSSKIILPIVVVLGLTHGYSNGSAFEPNLSIVNYVLGVATTGLVVVAFFSALSLSAIKEWQKIAVRVAGSWIAAIGLITVPMIFK